MIITSHHTQISRGSQLQKVRDLIIQVGGFKFMEDKIGLQTFLWYVADEINCTPQKAREYVQTCKRGAIARAKIQSLKARVNDAKTPSHPMEKKGKLKDQLKEPIPEGTSTL